MRTAHALNILNTQDYFYGNTKAAKTFTIQHQSVALHFKTNGNQQISKACSDLLDLDMSCTLTAECLVTVNNFVKQLVAPILLEEGRVSGIEECDANLFIKCPYDYSTIQHNIWVAGYHDGYWWAKKRKG